MIFITVGTQKFQFDRLFKELDYLVEQKNIKEKIIAQIGFSDYKPIHYEYETMMTEEKMKKLIEESSLVISHAGTSSIILSLKMGKKVLVVPREQKFKEHVDNHQIEIAELFHERGLIETVYDIGNLESKIALVKKNIYESYKFDNTLLLSSIDEYINQIYELKNKKQEGSLQ